MHRFQLQMHRLRVRYADVAATLALVLALGGSAYAAGVIPAGSVGSRQLATGAVSQAKLAFPLGIASRELEWVSLAGFSCPPGAPCPPVPEKAIASLTLHVARAGSVAVRVSGAAQSPAGAEVAVTLGVERSPSHISKWLTEARAPSANGIAPLNGEVVFKVPPGSEHLVLTATNGPAVTLTHLRFTATVMPTLK